MSGDLAEDVEGAGLDSALAPLARQAERSLGSDLRLVGPTGEEIRLAEVGSGEGLEDSVPASGSLGRLLQKRKRRALSPGHRIGMAQPTCQPGIEAREGSGAREAQTP